MSAFSKNAILAFLGTVFAFASAALPMDQDTKAEADKMDYERRLEGRRLHFAGLSGKEATQEGYIEYIAQSFPETEIGLIALQLALSLLEPSEEARDAVRRSLADPSKKSYMTRYIMVLWRLGAVEAADLAEALLADNTVHIHDRIGLIHYLVSIGKPFKSNVPRAIFIEALLADSEFSIEVAKSILHSMRKNGISFHDSEGEITVETILADMSKRIMKLVDDLSVADFTLEVKGHFRAVPKPRNWTPPPDGPFARSGG